MWTRPVRIVLRIELTPGLVDRQDMKEEEQEQERKPLTYHSLACMHARNNTSTATRGVGGIYRLSAWLP